MEPEEALSETASDIVADPVSQIGHNIGDTLTEISHEVQAAVSRKLDEKAKQVLEEHGIKPQPPKVPSQTSPPAPAESQPPQHEGETIQEMKEVARHQIEAIKSH